MRAVLGIEKCRFRDRGLGVGSLGIMALEMRVQGYGLGFGDWGLEGSGLQVSGARSWAKRQGINVLYNRGLKHYYYHSEVCLRYPIIIMQG